MPGVPLCGLKPLIDAPGTVTVNVPPFAVPALVVTTMFPDVVPSGTRVVIWPSLSTRNGADCPLKLTAVAPEKYEPLITTVVPTEPDEGVRPPMAGGIETEEVFREEPESDLPDDELGVDVAEVVDV